MAEVKSEFELIQDSYLRVWQIFMSWFTWFVNINLIALGWLLTAQIQKPVGAICFDDEDTGCDGAGCHHLHLHLHTDLPPAGQRAFA